MKRKLLIDRKPHTPVKLSWGSRHVIKTALVLALVVPPLALALLGDVNDDGQVNETDATWIMESIAGSRTPIFG